MSILMKRWSQQEIDFLNKNYSQNGTAFCSENLNRDRKSVQKKASKLKLYVEKEVIKNLRSSTVKESWNKRTDSENNLSKILKIPLENFTGNENSLYFMGYLWGDGSIIHKGVGRENSLRLEIVKEDALDIFDKMNSLINWNIYTRKRTGRREMMSFTITNRILTEHFLTLGYGQKSLIAPKFLEDIPIPKRRHFYMGLSDADGCWYFNKKNKCYQYTISSTFDQDWKHITDLFDHLEIKYSIRRRKQNRKDLSTTKSSSVVVSNRNDVIKLGEYLYTDCFIGLRRKHEKYLHFKIN